jgi:hypothetical protein
VLGKQSVLELLPFLQEKILVTEISTTKILRYRISVFMVDNIKFRNVASHDSQRLRLGDGLVFNELSARYVSRLKN